MRHDGNLNVEEDRKGRGGLAFGERQTDIDQASN